MRSTFPNELSYPLLVAKIEEYLQKTPRCPGHHPSPCVYISWPDEEQGIVSPADPYPSCPFWVAERTGFALVLAYLRGRVNILDPKT